MDNKEITRLIYENDGCPRCCWSTAFWDVVIEESFLEIVSLRYSGTLKHHIYDGEAYLDDEDSCYE